MNNSSNVQCSFVVADRGIAAIDDIEADTLSGHDCYDLQGRRVDSSNAGRQIVLKRDSQGKIRKMINR
jgi:hypothetical protein